MPDWTAEQCQAIDSRGRNLLVSAAAGSGKTAVLVARILSLTLDDQVDLDRLLVVTFTRAAAWEMRKRISRALTEQAQGDSPRAALAQRQLRLLDKASICTLHACCAEIVRNFFYLYKFDETQPIGPDFRIVDTAQSALMIRQALDITLEEAYAQADDGMDRLVSLLCNGRSDQQLALQIERLYHFTRSQPDPEEWMARACAQMDGPQADASPWAQALIDQAQLHVDAAHGYFDQALAICRMPDGPAAYIPALEEDLRFCHDIRQSLRQGWSSLAVLEYKPARLPSKGGPAGSKWAEAAKAARDSGKRAVLRLLDQAEESMRTWPLVGQCASAMRALCELVSRFDRQYRRLKSARNMMDFADLEHGALAILRQPDAALYYRERYEAIFVDEYQDSNLIQESILSYIAREDNLFLVGDIKQSIYRFRLADPTLFIRRSQREDALHGQVLLQQNFRSRPSILHAVNTLFSPMMSPRVGEIRYDHTQALVPGRTDGEGAPVELMLVDRDALLAALEDTPDGEPLEQLAAEAQLIAARMLRLAKENPAYAWRDMVILLRSPASCAPIYMEALLAQGIPSCSDTGANLLDLPEVAVFLSLLRCIDNRRNDTPLLSAMLWAGRFTLEETAAIRLAAPDQPFYEAMLAMTKKVTPLGGKARSFWQQLAGWQALSRAVSLRDFLWEVLYESGYWDACAALPNGQERQRNLMAFIGLAQSLTPGGAKGLYGFLRMLLHLEGRPIAAPAPPAEANAVRILSIHKSKGLEFPVVFLAGLGRMFNLTDTHARLLLHRELGFGPMYTDPALAWRSNTLARQALSGVIAMEGLSEEMRLLYVGMTRAKEKLILSGAASLARDAARWCAPMQPWAFAQARCSLDLIGPALMRHPDGDPLRVYTCMPPASLPDKARFAVTISDGRLMETVKVEAAATGEGEAPWNDRLSSCLDWEYPALASTRLPAKLTVTGLTHPTYRLPPMPASPPRHGMSAMQRGTLMHRALQYLLPYRPDCATIHACINQLEPALTPQERQSLDRDALARFFASPLAAQIAAAETVLLEQPFNLRMAARKLDAAAPEGDYLLVQGVIDVLYQLPGGWGIVDYKTDRVPAGQARIVAEQYRGQLALYAQAVQTILNQPVVQLHIYLLDSGDDILMEECP